MEREIGRGLRGPRSSGLCGMGPPQVRVRRKLSKAHRHAVPLLPRALYGSDFRSAVA